MNCRSKLQNTFNHLMRTTLVMGGSRLEISIQSGCRDCLQYFSVILWMEPDREIWRIIKISSVHLYPSLIRLTRRDHRLRRRSDVQRVWSLAFEDTPVTLSGVNTHHPPLR
ncbi:hypothetical protein PsorP6_004610 [Peronosclerospora sorghi]|uniref:Uncharacterized protein n=1 Tax=Peronosclerospora sorghi TaxID=230839 RepID=A0ACC0VJQ4_9STRA|nr:hypothetical protein PsorP6_004610 [Peronosclerospora sorghi]